MRAAPVSGRLAYAAPGIAWPIPHSSWFTFAKNFRTGERFLTFAIENCSRCSGHHSRRRPTTAAAATISAS